MEEKILVVDDNKDIISFIKPALESRGFTVDYTLNGISALQKIDDSVSLILLDVILPDFNGFDICKRIRKQVKCPIVFLTARGLEEERIKGFLVGGDDYIVKPFSLGELIARVTAHLRREKRNSKEEHDNKLMFNDLTIDLIKRTIVKNGIELELTKKEFELIELLCTRPGQVFSKEQIFDKLWGYDSESSTDTITEHIKRIRSKLKYDNNNCDYIKTVWGVGYKWDF